MERHMLNWLERKSTPADDMTITMPPHSGAGTLSCGGKFARDMPIMCPRYKSASVEYDLGMIT